MQHPQPTPPASTPPASTPPASTPPTSRDQRFRSFFGRPPTPLDLEREERTRQLLLLGVPGRVKRTWARVITRQ